VWIVEYVLDDIWEVRDQSLVIIGGYQAINGKMSDVLHDGFWGMSGGIWWR
jgi:hypothetical protein